MSKMSEIKRLILPAVLLITGCASMILPEEKEPVYYQLDYQPKKIQCKQTYQKDLRVGTFTVSSPFDQDAMVVLDPGQQVSPSSRYRWVSNPGAMVAESLLRDLDQGEVFNFVVGPEDPKNTPLELTGHIFEFAWEKSATKARAVFKIKVSLRDRKSGTVPFSREYTLQSREYGKTETSAVFASAMSGVVSDFSTKLRQDLCASLNSG